MIKSKLILIFVFISLSVSTFAQWEFDMHKGNLIWRNWFLKADAGLNMLYADNASYNHDPIYKMRYESRLGLSGVIGKWITPWVALGGNLSMGQLYSFTENRESNGVFYQLTGEVYININQIIHPSYQQDEVYFYTKIGYGLIYFNAEMTDIKTGEVLRQLGKPNGFVMPNTEWVIPIGFGLVYNINTHFSASLDGTVNFTVSDKLDACYSNNENAHNDLYVFIAAGLTYTFNFKSSQGSYRRPRARRSNHW